MGHEIKLTPALEGLKGMESSSVGLVVTDPPYNTLEKWRAVGTTTRLTKSDASSNEWFPTVDFDYLKDVFRECYRVLKPNTHMYILCDEETADYLKPIVDEIGFKRKKSLIWHKVGKKTDIHCPKCGTFVHTTNSPGAPGMGYPYRSSYEMILLLEKGKRPMPTDLSVRNVLSFPYLKGKSYYPTEKPVEMLEVFITQSSNPGDLVLDPFAGSGSTGVAAYNLGREFLGFDVQERSLEYFSSRLGEVSLVSDTGDTKDEPSVFDLFGGE